MNVHICNMIIYNDTIYDGKANKYVLIALWEDMYHYLMKRKIRMNMYYEISFKRVFNLE